MKNYFLFTFFLIITHFAMLAQYCIPINNNGCLGHSLELFTLKGESGSVIRNPSGVCSSQYSYFSSGPVVLCKGGAYTGFIRTTNNNDYVSIWIDANDNFIFENTERVLNNLKASTSDLLYSILVPDAMASGMHRMRIRNIHSMFQPSGTTDPCNAYTYGETEDYDVMISNGSPAIRPVADGIPGLCTISSRTTIDAVSNNNMADSIQLLDSSNHPLCAFVPNGVTFGTVYASVFVNNGPTRQTPQGAYYMDRNYKIIAGVTPSSLFQLRLYYKTSELVSLRAHLPYPNSIPIDSLFMYRNTDPCQTVLFDLNGQTFRNNHSTNDYTQISVASGGLGNYYIGLDTLGFICASPVNVGVTLNSSTSIILSWMGGSNATSSFQYTISQSATPPPVGTNTSLNSIGIGGLINGQRYYAHVRSKCGSVFSTWVTLPFTTILNDRYCNASNLTLAGLSQCDNTTFADAIGDPSLSCSNPNNTLWYKFSSALNGNYMFRVTTPAINPLHGYMGWYELNGTCPSATLNQMAGAGCAEFGQSGSNDIDSIVSPYLLAGNTYYIMIDGVSGDAGQFCIQALSHLPPLACCTNNTPVNSATNVYNLSPITLSWSASSGALSYDLYFGTVDPPPLFESNLLTTTKTFQWLDYNTTYYWYVIPKNLWSAAQGCVTNRSQFSTYHPPICLPIYGEGCSNGDSISYFSLKGEGGSVIYNASGSNCNSTTLSSYTDYTPVFNPVQLARGYAYSGYLQTGQQADYVSIWIDADDDLYYEDSECVLSNLQVGTSKLLYSMMIPNTVPTGIHRLRVRNVAYPQMPLMRTDACNQYEYGEAEDYLIHVVNTTPSRQVAPGEPGQCILSSTTMIDSFSNNSSLLTGVSLLDSMNRNVATLYADQQNFGRTSFDYYVHDGNVRLNSNAKPYLNRDLHLFTIIQPLDSFGIRFDLKANELDTLLLHPFSGVSNMNDLVLLSNQDACGNSLSSNPSMRGSVSSTGPTSGPVQWIEFVAHATAKGFYILSDCIPTIVDTLVTVCGTEYQWIGNTYTSSGNYSMSFLNSKGCDSVLNLVLTLKAYPPIGAAFTKDSLICLGKPIELEYESCSINAGFSNYYSIENWERDTIGNSNAAINSSASKDSLIFISSDGLSGLGQTSIKIAAACHGNISFDWHYSTVDGPVWDFPQFTINDSEPEDLPGYSFNDPGPQSGSFSLALNKGDTLQLQIWSLDNLYGPCTLIIDNFQAQIPNPGQQIVWYRDVAAIDTLGTGHLLTIMADSVGLYYYYAKIQDSITNCVSPIILSSNLVTIDSCNLKLDLRLFLQGYSYENFSTVPSSAAMHPALFNQGVSTDSMLVDSILVILYQPFPLEPVDSVFTALSVEGFASCTFNEVAGNYYVAIRHRNSVETWIANPLNLSDQITFYDFSQFASSAYGENLIEIPGNRWAFFAGDIFKDENVDVIDLVLIDLEIYEFSFGYYAQDINGDGNVDLLDLPNVEKNVNDFIFSLHP